MEMCVVSVAMATKYYDNRYQRSVNAITTRVVSDMAK